MTYSHPLAKHIRDYPDFPIPGILFKDISPLLMHYWQETLVALSDMFSVAQWEEVDAIAGIEARGFLLAGGLACMQKKGLVMIRKVGKLPGKTLSRSYGLEYAQATMEIHPGQGNILVLDDVVATGGTLQAALELAVEAGYTVKGFGALLNIAALNSFSWRGMTPHTVITV